MPTLEEMRAKAQELNDEIARREREEKIAALKATKPFQAVRERLEKLNATADEILAALKGGLNGGGKQASPSTVVTNPADPTQTWSGRGRPPAWVKEMRAQQ